jgi:diguanylate cyclase (GGDEF)-like protein/PAS domain S-box-containing protein
MLRTTTLPAEPAASLCLACCPHVLPEVRACLRELAEPDVVSAAFSRTCACGDENVRRIHHRLAGISRRYDNVVAFGGPCLSGAEAGKALPANVSLRVFEDCLTPLVDGELLQSMVGEGSYLFTSGWLQGWRARLGDQGLGQAWARAPLNGPYTQLVFLDAGVTARAAGRAQAVGDHTGLPLRVVPIKLRALSHFVHLMTLEWRFERPRAEDRSQDATRQAADYAMALDLLGQLAGLRSEQELRARIADLMRLLFACSQACYVPLDHFIQGQEADQRQSLECGDTLKRVMKETMATKSEHGEIEEHNAFWVKIGNPSRPTALLMAGDFAFPQYKRQYLNLALNLARVFGLAVSNARAHQELSRTRNELEESEHRYRTLVSEAGEAMVVVDPRGIIVETNRRIEELLLAPAGTLVGQKLVDLVRPDERRHFRERLDTLNGNNAIALNNLHFAQARAGDPVIVDITATALRLEGQGLYVQAIIRDSSARAQAERELRALSLNDELTGLNNRRGFASLGPRQLELAARLGRRSALFFMDLDGMKEINDNLGHHEGDRALRLTAAVLQETFRRSDLIGRLGGDEFVALTLVKSPEDSEKTLSRLQDNLRRRNTRGDLPFSLELSVGVISLEASDERSLDSLLEAADRRMYEDKRRRKREHEPASHQTNPSGDAAC